MNAEQFFNNGFGADVEKVHRKHVIELMTNFAKHYHTEQCNIANVGQSLPDAEQCLKIQEQVKQYCYTDQDDKPVISSGGIRAIISRWKQIVG